MIFLLGLMFEVRRQRRPCPGGFVLLRRRCRRLSVLSREGGGFPMCWGWLGGRRIAVAAPRPAWVPPSAPARQPAPYPGGAAPGLPALAVREEPTHSATRPEDPARVSFPWLILASPVPAPRATPSFLPRPGEAQPVAAAGAGSTSRLWGEAMPRSPPQRGAAMRGQGAGWRASSRGSETFLRAVGLRGSRRAAAGGGVCGRAHSVRGVEWGGEAQQRQAISRSLCARPSWKGHKWWRVHAAAVQGGRHGGFPFPHAPRSMPVEPEAAPRLPVLKAVWSAISPQEIDPGVAAAADVTPRLLFLPCRRRGRLPRVSQPSKGVLPSASRAWPRARPAALARLRVRRSLGPHVRCRWCKMCRFGSSRCFKRELKR